MFSKMFSSAKIGFWNFSGSSLLSSKARRTKIRRDNHRFRSLVDRLESLEEKIVLSTTWDIGTYPVLVADAAAAHAGDIFVITSSFTDTAATPVDVPVALTWESSTPGTIHTISATTTDNILAFTGPGATTITDLALVGGGTGKTSVDLLVQGTAGTTVTMTNGSLTGALDGLQSSGATVSTKNVSFSTDSNAGEDVFSGTLTDYADTFNACGTAVYSWSNFSAQWDKYSGSLHSAIELEGSNQTTINNSQFLGGVSAGVSGISSPDAMVSGGLVSLTYDTFKTNGTGGSADPEVVSINTTGSVRVAASNSTFQNNNAGCWDTFTTSTAGGVVVLTNNSFLNNVQSTTFSTPPVIEDSGGTVEIVGCNITDNVDTEGAILQSYGSASSSPFSTLILQTCVGANVSGSSTRAADDAGMINIALRGGDTGQVSACTIVYNNVCENFGGGVAFVYFTGGVGSPTGIINNSTIAGDEATGATAAGGAVYFSPRYGSSDTVIFPSNNVTNNYAPTDPNLDAINSDGSATLSDVVGNFVDNGSGVTGGYPVGNVFTESPLTDSPAVNPSNPFTVALPYTEGLQAGSPLLGHGSAGAGQNDGNNQAYTRNATGADDEMGNGLAIIAPATSTSMGNSTAMTSALAPIVIPTAAASSQKSKGSAKLPSSRAVTPPLVIRIAKSSATHQLLKVVYSNGKLIN